MKTKKLKTKRRRGRVDEFDRCRDFICPKCTNKNVYIRYNTGTGILSEKNILECVCYRCDYRWGEKPSDEK